MPPQQMAQCDEYGASCLLFIKGFGRRTCVSCCQQIPQPTSLLKNIACSWSLLQLILLCLWPPLLSKNTSMGRIVALGDMIRHYNARDHCGLFWVNAPKHCPAALMHKLCIIPQLKIVPPKHNIYSHPATSEHQDLVSFSLLILLHCSWTLFDLRKTWVKVALSYVQYIHIWS